MRATTAVLLLLPLCACSTAGPGPATAPAADPFARVRFLVGTWQSEGSPRQNVEAWAAPAGAVMHGVNRTQQGGKQVFFELLCIHADGDHLDYEANQGEAKGTRFRLVEAGPDTATFTNPQHDFPKRIHYRREGDAMHARVDGGEGSDQKIEFHWKRLPDPAEGR